MIVNFLFHFWTREHRLSMICTFSLWFLQAIIYNYWTPLNAIWCVMEHWKAILTKAEVRCQYCFSVLHNTSHCSTWSAVIVLLHLTHQFFSNSKPTELIHLISLNSCTKSVCTNSYLHSAAFVELSVSVTSLQRK